MKNSVYRKYCLIIIFLISDSIQIMAQNGWTHITNLPTPRAGATASVVNGKIYAIGGSITGLIDVAYNEAYDPLTNTWNSLAPMPTPRGFLTSEVVNGIIYVIGGGYPTATNKNEAYDPANNSWTPKADLPWPPRLGMRAGVVNGIIYVIAGNYNQRDCYAYNPSTNTWETKASMPVGGGGALSVTAYNGLVYTFGGSTYSPWAPLPHIYAYNPQTNQWTQKQNMPTSRFELHTYLVGDTIYAVGGSQSEGSSVATVEAYYPITDTWDTRPNMPIQRSYFAGAVANSNIYVIGGTTNWSNTLGDVWEFDPTWVVPVELTSFTVLANGKEVTLNWSTATELNNFEFEVQRSFEGSEFVTVGVVYGKGTTTERQDYTYSDKNLSDGKYFYRLKQVDYDGSYEYSDVVEVDYRGFNSYLLEQNYPNPFNPTTTIGFGLQNKSNVKIIVLNSIGEEVAVLLNEEREPGFHQVEFNANSLPSGVYFYRLQAEDFVEMKKMLLLK